MNKIIFANQTEIEISGVTQSGDTLTVSINTDDANYVIEKFSDKSATSVMRYYAGIDLIRGYSGFTILENVKFTPDVVTHIDYETTDQYTESGFVEEKTDQCVVTMRKESILASVANQTAQNTTNIDYLATKAGVEL